MLTPKQREHLNNTLVPMAKLLTKMEMRGLRVDVDDVERRVEIREEELARLEKLAKRQFKGVNFQSPKQMQQLLFGEMGLKPIKHNKTGPSTDAETLEELSKKNRKLKKLVRIRQLKRELSAELGAWLRLQRNGYLHTTYKFGDVVTGRLASENPNLQNVKRDAEHKACLISRYRNGKMIQLDYSQHELRIIATYAGVRYLLRAWQRDPNADPHQATADQLRVDRDTGKRLNFALTYGMGVNEFMAQTGWTFSKCKRLRDKWIQAHPQIVKFWAEEERHAREHGYIENPFGRRRHLDDLDETRQKKQAYNFRTQSYAVEIVYRAMLELDQALGDSRAIIVHQIHDSIILDCPNPLVKKVTKLARDVMCSVKLPMAVPLAVDVKIGDSLAA